MKIKCEICGYKKINTIKSTLPGFTHLNFLKICKKLNFNNCQNCGIIKINNKNTKKKIEKIFKSKLYSESKQSSSLKLGGPFGKLKKRIDHQLDILENYFKINKKKINFLDVGCFDGSLIKKINKKYDNFICYGYDINSLHFKSFKNKKKLKFLKKETEIKKYKYDYVLFSHSIQYINNINNFISSISRRLNEKGKIIIQIPNIEKNNFYCLMGDQCNLFTKNNLRNILLYNNFRLISSKKYFNNELFLVFQKTKIDKKKFFNSHRLFLKKILKNIYSKKRKLEILKKKIDKNYIIGTNIDSAFFDESLKSHKTLFFDQAGKKKFFRGKKVFDKLPNSEKNLKIIISKNLIKSKLYSSLKSTFRNNLLII